MPLSDFLLVFQWWGTLFLVGAAVYPITKTLFGRWFDRGFFFTKAVGMALVTFVVYILGMFHIAPFTTTSIWIVMAALFVAGIPLTIHESKKHTWKRAVMLLFEELFFFGALLFWTWVKAHEPSIHNLEKYMDFGFTKSILNSRYFPAPDMWYSGFPINYYYFGHTVMAVLTKLSGIDLSYTFNLMLATIFAFTATMSFSIGVQLLRLRKGVSVLGQLLGGLLTSFLTTMAGNMQTIYTFTRGYTGENVQPFWSLAWSLKDIGGIAGIWNGTLWAKLTEGMNIYWYANATRFIPYTIHEFPSYSFVVSDVHGHVLSIPFVLLAIALLLVVTHELSDRTKNINFPDIFRHPHPLATYLFYGFLCGVLFMTNALDGPIYLTLFIAVIGVFVFTRADISPAEKWRRFGTATGLTLGAVIVTSAPFLFQFKSFVNGLAVNCPPAFLADIRIGPIVFEGVEKCQHSPLWMWWLLWGFFVYSGGWLIASLYPRLRLPGKITWKHLPVLIKNIHPHEMLLCIVLIFSILLLIFPEFFYFKDIYPMHFRSNTMFKLGYQAFIMLSLVSGYTIMMYFLPDTHIADRSWRNARIVFFVLLVPQLFLVSIYPIFSIRSYFNSVKVYEGIYGLGWLDSQYPDDREGIAWLNTQITKQSSQDKMPVIVEADGDSYTDYNYFSAFTGLSSVIGWPVHEWLWRGSYDVVSPRRDDVREIYESTDIDVTQTLLDKYNVRFVIVGAHERQKFKNLADEKFITIGKPVFTHGKLVIYDVD